MDAVSRQFLELVRERAEKMERDSINGHQIKDEMGLDMDEYIRVVDRLQEGGYIHAPGGLAKNITLLQ